MSRETGCRQPLRQAAGYEDDEDDDEDLKFITFVICLDHVWTTVGPLVDHLLITFGALLDNRWTIV
eukprot:15192475-Heterocapsa_arctica.AAC.1